MTLSDSHCPPPSPPGGEYIPAVADRHHAVAARGASARVAPTTLRIARTYAHRVTEASRSREQAGKSRRSRRPAVTRCDRARDGRDGRAEARPGASCGGPDRASVALP